ncbi:MAG: flagellar basal body rod protein FlgB [Treponemataceae bacterium]|nr:MAG: flagellar basal body rod protein FlgB [Treponemataceae bacterium]
MNDFTRTVDLLHRAMDVSTLRYQVSANNLANAEVPNFKRSSVAFEAMLKRAFESEQANQNALELKAEGPYTLSTKKFIDWRTVEPRRLTDFYTTSKANGNNVDAEQEAMDILKTQLNYRLLTQLQAHEFSQIRTAMRK